MVKTDWKLLFSPGLFYYGVGISCQPLSIRQFKNGEGLIGHWGQTRAFAFYDPKTDLYFTGTVNQFFGQNVVGKIIREIIKRYKGIYDIMKRDDFVLEVSF